MVKYTPLRRTSIAKEFYSKMFEQVVAVSNGKVNSDYDSGCVYNTEGGRWVSIVNGKTTIRGDYHFIPSVI